MNMNPQSEFFGWAIFFATFFGPIFAVFTTRFIDSRRDQHQRQLHVLRSLMATRRTLLSNEHVNALNLIEIEFHGKVKVVAAWRAYLSNLATKFDPKDVETVTRERQKLFTKMLSEMTKAMKIRLEQMDLFDSGYYPQAAVDLESQQAAIRQLLADIAQGKKSFPIEIKSTSETSASRG
jgi:hypothetical protein